MTFLWSLFDQREDLACDVALHAPNGFELEMTFGYTLCDISLLRGSVRNRPMAMICRALLAARSPPLLSRWRVVLPDEAGTGLTPHRAAKLASERKRCTLSPAVRSNCAADSWPIEFRATRLGASSSTRATIMVSRSAISSCSSRYRRPSDFRVIR